MWNGVWEYGDIGKAFKEAAYVVNIDRMHFHRFSHAAREQRHHRTVESERRAHLLLV